MECITCGKLDHSEEHNNYCRHCGTDLHNPIPCPQCGKAIHKLTKNFVSFVVII